jgi:hypothetical protein
LVRLFEAKASRESVPKRKQPPESGCFLLNLLAEQKVWRTPDLCNAIAALSQLSYGPVSVETEK